MSTRTLKDATKALQATFTAAKIPLSLPSESRRMLQSFVDEHGDEFDEEDSAQAHTTLKEFWENYVGENVAKTGAFMGVLRELRPTITREADILEWWHLVVRPVLTGNGYRKPAMDDAHEFLVGCMVLDEDDEEPGQARAGARLLGDLLSIYLARTRGLTNDDRFIAPENAQVVQHVENVLFSFGRKRPKDLLNSMDDLIIPAGTRLQGLTLLNSFLRHQTPHIYLVIHTPLVEHLLKCLMNDLSTTVLSVALTSLIMLLPHIPGSLGPHLPRLFLIYSRLLCWEKFSPLSSEAQKNLVTDERLVQTDHGDVGIDSSWEKARPKEGVIEAATPELMSYFTFLYGLYPLNFASYIRKPRRYLKTLDFPGAEDFDLDQAVIRSRTDQFRQVHLLHPNFYNMTAEEELNDPKWPKADPADVVAECNALCMHTKPTLLSPGPPPTSRLPDVPPLPPLVHKGSNQVSPSTSHASLRSGNSWRDTQSTAVSAQTLDGESPVLRPVSGDSGIARPRSKASATNRESPNLEDLPQPGTITTTRQAREKEDGPQTNLAYLQRENTLLKTELNFERWHKSQYSQHIAQLMRKNVKDATAEAETLNLINANRALKQQLEQVRSAREATVKDSALTRKQANSLETNMTERFNSLKKEQEVWRADSGELQRLRKETGQYRDLLVATEARELNKSHHLEIVKRDLEQMQRFNRQLQEAQRKLREYEYREFEMDEAKRELEIVEHERDTLKMRAQRQQHDLERSRRAYTNRIEELESQLDGAEKPNSRSGGAPGQDTQALIQHAIADSQTKLAQFKRKHTALMERFTDLEIENECMKSQLQALQTNRKGGQPFYKAHADDDAYILDGPDRHAVQDTMTGALGGPDSAYDTSSDHNLSALSDNAYIISTSDPAGNRRPPPSSNSSSILTLPSISRSEHTIQSLRQPESLTSRGSSAHPFHYNQTTPLTAEEMQMQMQGAKSGAASVWSSDSGKRKEKVQPDSKVRVYGRGGAQNIKLKVKEGKEDGKQEKRRFGGLRLT